jgi:simple sugar transport system ATP-binding protein
MSLSDRIGVLYRGRIVGEFDGATATREDLGYLMATGAAPDPDDSEAPPLMEARV